MKYAIYDETGRLVQAVNDATLDVLPPDAVELTDELFSQWPNYWLLEGVLVYVPPPAPLPPTPLEQIRALEAPFDDAMKKINRQLAIALLLKEACARPEAAGLSPAQVSAFLIANEPDKAYAKMVALEAVVAPLRELIP